MASTYVNDLRLNEMATGDESGNWGNVTNTNLELIGDALGYGTEAITTNADTHTSTIADGAADPVRAMYVKYTGTLDSACTITIAPNTVNRMQFIENGTSGSQNIIIKQGTGATITIPPGDTKAVYMDGAGSGAAVVDAFASLSTVDLKVQDDLTVTDDATIGGTLGVTGVVTANAGVAIDNITIDGTEIDLSSGDLTLDVAGDIILDADGDDIFFAAAGTNFGKITNSSSDMLIRAMVQDKDIIFKGDDAGSVITALTLDMSEAGAATFNSSVLLSGTGGLTTTGGNNLTVSGSVADHAGLIMATHAILPAEAGAEAAANVIDLGANGNEFKTLYLDTSIITSNALEIATGTTFTLDAGGQVDFDTGNGEFHFLSAGTTFGKIFTSGNDFYINQPVADEDIIFSGTDGSSSVTALQLDMSEHGNATFNGGMVVNETSNEADFRVEGDSYSHLLFADSSTNHVAVASDTATSCLKVGTRGVKNAIQLAGGPNGNATKLIMVDSKTGSFSQVQVDVQLSGAGGYYYHIAYAGTGGVEEQSGGGYTNGTANFSSNITQGSGFTISTPSSNVWRAVSDTAQTHPVLCLEIAQGLAGDMDEDDVTITYS
tara:strand:+ start:1032 stop:2846 length:1815 start_codon:yes stop_codon:yes gene_type:complete